MICGLDSTDSPYETVYVLTIYTVLYRDTKWYIYNENKTLKESPKGFIIIPCTDIEMQQEYRFGCFSSQFYESATNVFNQNWTNFRTPPRYTSSQLFNHYLFSTACSFVMCRWKVFMSKDSRLDYKQLWCYRCTSILKTISLLRAWESDTMKLFFHMTIGLMGLNALIIIRVLRMPNILKAMPVIAN